MDAFDLVREAAIRHGVDPELALRVARRESSGDQSAVSPKGAIGVMQLMPKTARGLGVDPHDMAQNIEGGVRYLKQQLDSFGSPKLAVAAYNAGPGAVRKYGGVPPYAETQAYVAATSGGRQMQEFDGSSIFGGGDNAQQAAGGFDGSALFADAAPAPAPKPAPKPLAPPPGRPVTPVAARPAAPQRSGGMDATLGLLSGAQKGFAGLADMVTQATPVGGVLNTLQGAANMAGLMQGQGPGKLPAPFSLNAQIAARNGYTPQTKGGRFAETVGTMLPNAAIPASAVGRGLNVVLPAAGNEAGQRIADAMHLDERGHQIAGAAGSVLGGGLASVRPAPKVAGLPKADLTTLEKTSKDAWAKVDASTARFGPADSKALAHDVGQIVAEADPALFPKSALWASKISGMVERGELTLGKLNTLKSRMGAQLSAGDEAGVGKLLTDRVEALIATSDDSSLAAAREAYKRLSKFKDVSGRVDDAELNRTSAGTGGNSNAQRQALKPLIKQRGNQRMKNATPDESKAIRKVVAGTPTQNALRVLSAFDPTAGKLQALLAGPLALGTGGLSLAMAPVGMAAKFGERHIENKNIQTLLDLIAAGGKAPKAPLLRIAPGAYTGTAAVTAPLLSATPAMASAKPKPKAHR